MKKERRWRGEIYTTFFIFLFMYSKLNTGFPGSRHHCFAKLRCWFGLGLILFPACLPHRNPQEAAPYSSRMLPWGHLLPFWWGMALPGFAGCSQELESLSLGVDCCSCRLCPLRAWVVNWTGVGNTFWMQLHNHHPENKCHWVFATPSLPSRVYFFSLYIFKSRLHKFHSLFMEKKCFQEWATAE